MRAFGPGSVSSLLKTVLDVVFVALCAIVGALGLMALLALILSVSDPQLFDRAWREIYKTEAAAVTTQMPFVKEFKASLNLTAWFSVLVVFVLAEVFREGARLRREAELTI